MSFSDYVELDRLGDSHAEHMVARCREEFLTSAFYATSTPPMTPPFHFAADRPTLAELVPQYTAVGITKRNAVRYVVDSHMRAVVGRGKGNRAARRATQLVYARAAAVGRDVEDLAARIARNRRQWAADEAAERYSESRTHRALANIINFHE